MNENFDTRQEIYGEATLGAANLEMVAIARKHGSSAKFCGSGGAVFGLCRDHNAKVMDDGWGRGKPGVEGRGAPMHFENYWYLSDNPPPEQKCVLPPLDLCILFLGTFLRGLSLCVHKEEVQVNPQILH